MGPGQAGLRLDLLAVKSYKRARRKRLHSIRGCMMTKQRKWFWTAATGLAFLGVILAAVVLLKHEPRFYRDSLNVQVLDSKEQSKEFVGQMAMLVNYMLETKGEWDFHFTQEQINSFFSEDFINLGEAENLRKHGIHQPRLVMEDDKVRLAFRYGSGPLATVISYDLRIWLAPKEVNVMAIEILAKRAGAVPVTSQSLLDGISDVVRTKGIEITWYRHDSNPVALVRFLSDRPNRSQLLRLAVKAGSLIIAGRSVGDGVGQQAVPAGSVPSVTSGLPLLPPSDPLPQTPKAIVPIVPVSRNGGENQPKTPPSGQVPPPPLPNVDSPAIPTPPPLPKVDSPAIPTPPPLPPLDR